jgi:hypothetical protein
MAHEVDGLLFHFAKTKSTNSALSQKRQAGLAKPLCLGISGCTRSKVFERSSNFSGVEYGSIRNWLVPSVETSEGDRQVDGIVLRELHPLAGVSPRPREASSNVD